MPRVRISAQLVEVPRVCACCGFPADGFATEDAVRVRGTKVIREEVKSQQFGVCGQCLLHLRRLTPAGQRPSIAMPGAWATFVERASPVDRLEYESLRRPQCQAVDVFADFETWGGTVRSFRFDSPDYAAAFARVNRDAGKNVLSVDLGADPSPVDAAAPWGPPAPALAPAALPPPPVYPAPSNGSRLGTVLAVAIGFFFVVCGAVMIVSERSREPPAIGTTRAVAAPAASTSVPAGQIAPPPDAGSERRRHRRRHRGD